VFFSLALDGRATGAASLPARSGHPSLDISASAGDVRLMIVGYGFADEQREEGRAYAAIFLGFGLIAWKNVNQGPRG
jgi:hypothetical protein